MARSAAAIPSNRGPASSTPPQCVVRRVRHRLLVRGPLDDVPDHGCAPDLGAVVVAHDVDGDPEEPRAGVPIRRVVVVPGPEGGDEGLGQKVVDGGRFRPAGEEAVHRRGVALEEDGEALAGPAAKPARARRRSPCPNPATPHLHIARRPRPCSPAPIRERLSASHDRRGGSVRAPGSLWTAPVTGRGRNRHRGDSCDSRVVFFTPRAWPKCHASSEGGVFMIRRLITRGCFAGATVALVGGASPCPPRHPPVPPSRPRPIRPRVSTPTRSLRVRRH